MRSTLLYLLVSHRDHCSALVAATDLQQGGAQWHSEARSMRQAGWRGCRDARSEGCSLSGAPAQPLLL
jgi:hypothetical protein